MYWTERRDCSVNVAPRDRKFSGVGRGATLTEHMPTGLSTQIEIDAAGVAWIAGTRTKVKEVVLDKLAHGWSPEEIHFQHRHLSMAQIHAALAYYYENQDRLDEEIRDDVDNVDRLSSAMPTSALKATLRAMRMR